MLLLIAFACAPPEVVDRAPGVRAPQSAPCDDLDPGRCLLPWPSNTFTRADPESATGLRLDIRTQSLPVPDDPSYLNLADGFSRITGVAAYFEGGIDESALHPDAVEPSLTAEGPVQVFNAQPGSARYGQRVALRVERWDASGVEVARHLVIGRPQEILEANADHVAVVLDSLGAAEERPRGVSLALGLAEPEDEAEAALVGYHAPTRQLLEEVGVDPSRVLRVWDFTTRSQEDITTRMHAMMAALDGQLDGLEVEIDSVVRPSDPNIAAIVRGRLNGAPGFLNEDGRLALDGAGMPQIVGDAAIEFRICVPSGTGSYRVALYGHGTGGDVSDDAFDSEMAAYGISKVNLRFDGWTGADFIDTLLGFKAFLEGSERSTAGLMQALAGGTALFTSLDGVLGEALSAETLGGEANPAAGRWPDTSRAVWLGGSLGGTLGAVLVAADPRFDTAVLNVPGAGWTHMIPHSQIYDAGVGSIMLAVYDDLTDLQLAILMSQGSWDEVDGAVWAEEALEVGGSFLLQQSMGDPILPEVGTVLLAAGLGAAQLEPALQPYHGLAQVAGPVGGGATLEQFRVPDTGMYDVHGFAARDTIAGAAALEQILEFLESAWAEEPSVSRPDLCVERGLDGTCDFTESWEEY